MIRLNFAFLACSAVLSMTPNHMVRAGSSPALLPLSPTKELTILNARETYLLPGKLSQPAVDTGVAADTAWLPLTEDVVRHYIALRRELDAFWKMPTNQALSDSAVQHAHIYSRDPNLSTIRMTGVEPILVFDYVELTAHHPTIMTLFTKSGLTPLQFAPTHVALVRAAIVEDISQQLGMPLGALVDTVSVLGKNVALVRVHQQELTDLQVYKHLKSNGGNSSDDLNP